MGAWKHESSFLEAKFVRQKCYVEKFGNEYNIVCAGLPKKCMIKKEDSLYYEVTEMDHTGKYHEITKEFKINDFEVGFKCNGKLRFKQVKGGVLLVPTEFSIKDNDNILKFDD